MAGFLSFDVDDADPRHKSATPRGQGKIAVVATTVRVALTTVIHVESIRAINNFKVNLRNNLRFP